MTKRLKRLLVVLSKALVNVFNYLGAWLLMGLAVALCAILFFTWLASEVLENETLAFDEGVRSFIHSHASPALTFIMRLMTNLGSALWLIVLGLCVAVAFTLAKWWRGAALFVVTMAGAIMLNITLKLIFRRARPDSYFETLQPSSFSFPSGHALLSLCFYGVVAYIIARSLSSPTVRLLIWTIAALIVGLIGLSRVYLGVHYPTDVLASYAVALAWVITVSVGDHLYGWRYKRRIEKRTYK
jgi:membrane-associated phospholipid phosphatase